MAVIKLVDKIVNAANNNEITTGIFLDLSKAFDTIKHDILLDKMAHYGFRGIVLDWFKSYLTNRKQFVEYNNCKSTIRLINSGMPQGSILGPLGFIIYVNDIPNSVPDLSLILFADDTSAFTSHKDLSTLNVIMNNGLSKLNTWFKSKLSLNLKKTNYMLLGTHNKTNHSKDKFKLSIDDTEVKEVSTFKFLGITVCLFVRLFLLYTGSIFRGKFKYPSVLPYGPVNLLTKILPGRTMLMILTKSVHVVLVFYIKLNNFFQKVLF